MADEALKEAPAPGAESQELEGERDRSTIAFPYGDLDDAVSVAKSVHAVGGSSCDWDQVAAHLSQSANSGGFRQKMLTAKVFGVVTYSQGKVTLESLGSRICDPKQENLAKADAFLAVPLYKAIFDRFKGNTLPPAAGLESEMVNLGVAKKQTGKARQVFQRSAQQAGFFWSGQDRLVMPARGNAPPAITPPDEKPPKPKGEGGGGGGGELDSLIQGLIDKLPLADADWSLEARRKWLLTAANNFDLIYKGGDETRSIKVTIEKENT